MTTVTKMNPKKLAASLHASVDELLAANVESATALLTILQNLMETETAVVVPVKGKGKAKPVAADEDDDLVEDDDDAVEDDDDDLVEDDDDAEEEETSEGIDLEDLSADNIASAFENAEFGEKHERVTGGIKEMEGEVDEFGFDAAGIYKAAKAKDIKAKRAALTEFLSKAHDVIDAITQFELDGVVEAVEEITGEDFKPTGRGAAAKELSAATALFKAAIAAE